MRPIVARPGILLVLLGAGGLLVACGTSSHPAAVTSATVAPTTKGRPGSDQHLTGALARAYAHVNLTAADVPGFAVSRKSREHETAAERRLEREMVRCTGGAWFNHGLAEEGSEDLNARVLPWRRA